MDSWSSFDETSLPNKYSFYSNLNIENIIENDIKYAKNFRNMKNVGGYHDLYIQSDTLLTNIFQMQISKLMILSFSFSTGTKTQLELQSNLCNHSWDHSTVVILDRYLS